MYSYSAAAFQVTLTAAETNVSPVNSWLEIAADRRPGVVALEETGGSPRYRERAALVAERPQALSADGFQPSERVPIPERDRLRFAIDLHGCLLHGAAAVPIDSRLTGPEQAG